MRVKSFTSIIKPSLICKRQGFTLIELVLVLVLAGIIATFAIPRWDMSINASADAQRLASQIQYTQMLAMTHAQDFMLNLSTSAGTYNISTTTGTAVPDPITGSNSTALGSNTAFGTITNLPNNLIAFDGLGIPYIDSALSTPLASIATIAISQGNKTYTVQINPTTGWVSFSQTSIHNDD